MVHLRSLCARTNGCWVSVLVPEGHFVQAHLGNSQETVDCLGSDFQLLRKTREGFFRET